MGERDDRQGVACDPTAIETAQRQRHRTLVEALLGTRVQEVVDRPDGYALRFAADDYAAITQFIDNERRCCPFLRFVLEVPPGGDPTGSRSPAPRAPGTYSGPPPAGGGGDRDGLMTLAPRRRGMRGHGVRGLTVPAQARILGVCRHVRPSVSSWWSAACSHCSATSVCRWGPVTTPSRWPTIGDGGAGRRCAPRVLRDPCRLVRHLSGPSGRRYANRGE